MIEVLDDELSFDDDGYSSALYRMRRLMKQKISKRKRAITSGSPRSVTSPRSLPEEDIGESGSPVGSPVINDSGAHVVAPTETTLSQAENISTTAETTLATNGLGITHIESNPAEGLSNEDHGNESEEEEEAVAQRHDSATVGEYAERMRTAAIMLAQLQQNVHTASPSTSGGSNRAASAKNTEQIRQRIIKEMMALEEQRMAKMKSGGSVSGGVDVQPAAAAAAATGNVMPISTSDTLATTSNATPGVTAAAGAAPSIHDPDSTDEIMGDEQLVAWVVNKEDPSGKCLFLLLSSFLNIFFSIFDNKLSILPKLKKKHLYIYIAAVFAEDWDLKKARIRASSPYGHLPNWRLLSVIVKHGSDLRQEQFAVQLIREMQRIWEDTGVDVWVK